MNCEDLVRYLSDYIDHNLDEALTAEAQEHLATCANCHVVLDTTQKTILLFRQHGEQRCIPADHKQDLFDELRATFLKRGRHTV